MKATSRIFVAGHRGMVGSAIARRLTELGYTNLLLRTRTDLDLRDEAQTQEFFHREQPDYVFIAAAKVGGIVANSSFPAQFIRDNIAIQNNLIHASWEVGVKRLLFLGSSCIYPKFAPQPISESALLTGQLEATNRPYAIAKIAGIEMCWSYNRQYGTKYLAAMPTNLYGKGDNYHPTNSHVIPALIHKIHAAKISGAPSVSVWGTGLPRREFLYSDDLADACVFLMNLSEPEYSKLLGSTEDDSFAPPIINIGTGNDIRIAELAEKLCRTIGYSGSIIYDTTKPDGTPRKLLDITRMSEIGWQAKTTLDIGLEFAYQDFCKSEFGI